MNTRIKITQDILQFLVLRAINIVIVYDVHDHVFPISSTHTRTMLLVSVVYSLNPVCI